MANNCYVQVAEYLIEQGADVNAQDKGGLIPLHNASSYGHVDIASLLINNNSLVNATDRLVYNVILTFQVLEYFCAGRSVLETQFSI